MLCVLIRIDGRLALSIAKCCYPLLIKTLLTYLLSYLLTYLLTYLQHTFISKLFEKNDLIILLDLDL